jgi:hypothetical protein
MALAAVVGLVPLASTTGAADAATGVPAVTTVAAADTSAATAAATTVAPGGYHAVRPTRVLDTRSGLGARGPVALGSTTILTVTGAHDVPATGVAAVALTVAVVAPTARGQLSASAHGAPAPATSNLNFEPGATTPNLVVVPVSSGGQVDLRLAGGTGSAQLIGDIAGWVESGTATAPGSVRTVAPSRLLDTRSGNGAPAGAVHGGGTLRLVVAGRGGLPATGVGAVFLNLTATGGTTAGQVTAGAQITRAVSTTSLSFANGQTVAALTLVQVSPAGTVDLRVTGAGTVHLIADVAGYTVAGTPEVVGAVGTVEPTRILDTRTAANGNAGPVYGGRRLTLQPTYSPGMPGAPVAAVALAITATDASAPAVVTALPHSTWAAETSNLNVVAGRTTTGFVVVPVAEAGGVDLAVTSSGHLQLTVDLVGYVLGTAIDTVPPLPPTGLRSTLRRSTSISLEWVNPTGSDVTGIVLRRSAGTVAPATPSSGTAVPFTGASVVDSGLAPGTTYSYTVFSLDATRNFSVATLTTATRPLQWNAPVSVTPFRGFPSTVSCPTTTWCLSSDFTGQARVWSGGKWSGPAQIEPSDPNIFLSNYNPVNCASPSYCLAALSNDRLRAFRNGVWEAPISVPVGTRDAGWGPASCLSSTFCALGSTEGYLSVFNGSTATTPVRPATNVSWWSMSCTSTKFCMAGGQHMVDGSGWVARWNGTVWSASKVDPAGYSLYSVSCTSTTFCMATDSGRYLRWNGTKWSAPAATGDASGGFQGRYLSCTSTTFCAVLDPQRGTMRWTGTAWSKPQPLDSVTDLNGGLDCASATMCMVVDQLGRYQRWNGTSWTKPVVHDPTSGGLTSLSCPTSDFCMLADQTGKVSRWTGFSWTALTPVTPHPAEVSCASPTWCLAIDSWSRQWRTWNGSWSAAHTIPDPYLRGLSCVDPTFCMAFSDGGKAIRFTGSGWTATQVFGSNGGAYRAECTSRTFCLALDDNTSRWSRWNGSSWSTPKAIAGTSASWPVQQYSCTSPTFCLAVDNNWGSYRFTGSTWVKVDTTGQNTQPRFLDCASDTVCLGVDYWGQAVSWNGTRWNPGGVATGLTNTDQLAVVACPGPTTCIVGGQSRVVTTY